MVCNKCGRKLKDSKSIERGYGPVCWAEIAEIVKMKKIRTSPIDPEHRTSENIPGQMALGDFPCIIPK